MKTKAYQFYGNGNAYTPSSRRLLKPNNHVASCMQAQLASFHIVGVNCVTIPTIQESIKEEFEQNTNHYII